MSVGSAEPAGVNSSFPKNIHVRERVLGGTLEAQACGGASPASRLQEKQWFVGLIISKPDFQPRAFAIRLP
jgi:hypothetical protein